MCLAEACSRHTGNTIPTRGTEEKLSPMWRDRAPSRTAAEHRTRPHHPIDLFGRSQVVGIGYEYRRSEDVEPIGRVVRDPDPKAIGRYQRWAVQLAGQDPGPYEFEHLTTAEIALWEEWREMVQTSPREVLRKIEFEVRTPDDFVRRALVDHATWNVAVLVYDYRDDLVQGGWLLDPEDAKLINSIEGLERAALDWVSESYGWRVIHAGVRVPD